MSHHPVAPVCQADTTTSDPATTTTTTTTLAPTPTTSIMSCPSGWTDFQDGCYKDFGSSTSTWIDNDALCLAEGARLPSIHSKEEENFLNNLSGGGSYFIGGYPKDNTWVWSDFTVFDYDNTYTNIYDGYCLYQSSDYIGDGWSSRDCRTDYNYHRICKLAL